MRREEELELLGTLPRRIAAFDDSGIQTVAYGQDESVIEAFLSILASGTAVQVSNAITQVFNVTSLQAGNVLTAIGALLAGIQQAANSALQGTAPAKSQALQQSLSQIKSRTG